MSTHHSIAKSGLVIATATAVSRVLGFIRDMLMANFFGAGLAAEAFVVAQRIPNLLRDLVGEGAANAAVVPVFSEYRYKKSPQEFWNAAHAMFAIVLLVVGILTVCGIIFTPVIVRMIAPGFSSDPEKIRLTVTLTRIVFPFALLISLAAFQTGILHTFKSFLAPALGPCMLNIGMIVSILLAMRLAGQPIVWVAWGVIVGGLLQFAIQVPAMRRVSRADWQGSCFGVKDLIPDFKNPVVQKIGALLGPRLVGSGVYQMNVFVDTMLASLTSIVGAGGIVAIYYANRIIQLPLAIFGVALSSAVLPTLAEHVAKEDLAAMRRTLSFALRAIYLVIMPAAIVSIVLAKPIIQVLFERGAFDAYATNITAAALVFYALGLLAFSGVRILISCFYSLQDTRTPMRSACMALIVNIVLCALFIFPLKIGGLALASSISATFNFFNLYYILKKRLGAFLDREVLYSVIKMTAASLVMGVACHATWKLASSQMNCILALGLALVAGFAVYAIGCILLRVKEAHGLLQWVFKRR